MSLLVKLISILLPNSQISLGSILFLLYWALMFTSLFMNNIFYSGSARLLNKAKTKAWTWLFYKQTNMNELFIKPSSSCLWTV